MARLLIKEAGKQTQVIELKLGLNRFGRVQSNDFQIEHPTISSRHCDVVVNEHGVLVHDRDSTNGTFVNGEPIKEALLAAGQVLRLGDVELLVDNTEVKVAIPKFEAGSRPAPPVVLTDGSLVCPRHPHARVTHQCTYCREVMCDACVHRLRRRGGKLLKLCPVCSHKCEPLVGVGRKRKGFLGFLKTVKLPFIRSSKKDSDDSEE